LVSFARDSRVRLLTDDRGTELIFEITEKLAVRLQHEDISRTANRLRLQFLDDTVAFARLRLGRDDAGRLRLRRTYGFEFSDTGDNRRQGAIVMLGARVESLQLEPFRLR
jgi:hypothetical protein